MPTFYASLSVKFYLSCLQLLPLRLSPLPGTSTPVLALLVPLERQQGYVTWDNMDCWNSRVECVSKYICIYMTLAQVYQFYQRLRIITEVCRKVGKILFSCSAFYSLSRNLRHHSLCSNILYSVDTTKLLLAFIYSSSSFLQTINMSAGRPEMTVISEEQTPCSSSKSSFLRSRISIFGQIRGLIPSSLRISSLSQGSKLRWKTLSQWTQLISSGCMTSHLHPRSSYELDCR